MFKKLLQSIYFKIYGKILTPADIRRSIQVGKLNDLWVINASHKISRLNGQRGNLLISNTLYYLVNDLGKDATKEFSNCVSYTKHSDLVIKETWLPQDIFPSTSNYINSCDKFWQWLSDGAIIVVDMKRANFILNSAEASLEKERLYHQLAGIYPMEGDSEDPPKVNYSLWLEENNFTNRTGEYSTSNVPEELPQARVDIYSAELIKRFTMDRPESLFNFLRRLIKWNF